MSSKIKKYIFTNAFTTVGFSILIADLILGIIGHFWTPYPPTATFTPNLPPSSQHLLGTDTFGHDVFSVMLVSTLPTLLVGLGIGALTTLISTAIGILGGYYGARRTGVIIDVATILALAIPGVLILILLGAYFQSASSVIGYDVVVFALAITGWAWGAKVMRAQVLSLSNREYIIASKLIGEKSWRIMFQQILPPIVPLTMGQFLFGTLYGVLSLTTAEFWGVIPVTTENLGTMLSLIASGSAYLIGDWWWILGAILPIVVMAIGIGFLIVGLDEISDPRLRKMKFTTEKIEVPIPTDEKVVNIVVTREEVEK
ncbi:sugar ABC transporter permease [Sulfolobus sp. A20]|uniref:ABC transporter permease n=1 Tax=Saccharolobus sp. A20 TaxID=1891280 RepID=UPI000846007F|nr:ABC transporter permease [Sulfolobus sp. A20]AOL16521.1 sugar ABC transporter permease [Sulfolobus sp. A20]TRM73869.1 ABC transporter permease [Sulfolobus sp. E5]TRM81398.1 ABC transporter permease [Sulfolobus sp. D5]TRN04082.1 ABC transporter permease [Sulfolobus sp. F1]